MSIRLVPAIWNLEFEVFGSPSMGLIDLENFSRLCPTSYTWSLVSCLGVENLVKFPNIEVISYDIQSDQTIVSLPYSQSKTERPTIFTY